MKLHEILNQNDKLGNSILIEEMIPRKKQLSILFADYLCCKPENLVLVVTSVMNTAQYGFVCDSWLFDELVHDYVDRIPNLTGEEKENKIELINFNSIMFSKL